MSHSPARVARATVLLLCCLLASCAPRERADAFPGAGDGSVPPNVVLILVDDLGWADLGAYGSVFHETPNIDGLAREGMLFTSAYAAAPVCSPTRASILTGKYPARLRQTDWIPGRKNRPGQRLLQVDDLNHLALEHRTLAEALGRAGYATAHVGKWHLGGGPYLPQHQGFDLNIAGDNSGLPPTYFWPYRDAYREVPGLAGRGRPGEYLTGRLAGEAAEFIAANRSRPFFLYLPFFAVHTPLQAPPELVRKYEAKAVAMGLADTTRAFGWETGHRYRRVQSNPVYAAMVESMDAAVGRVLEALRANGVADRTVVVFTSDNGGLATSEGWPTTNLPLRAGKGWLYEGGVRVPMIVRWPGVARPGSRHPGVVGSIDLYPTLLAAAGLPREDPVDGVNLLPVLRGGALARSALFWHYPHYSNQGGVPSGAVRRGNYKLIEFYEDGRLELYDLAADPGETHDLAAAEPRRTAALLRHLRGWRSSIGAQMPAPNPDFRAPERGGEEPPRPSGSRAARPFTTRG